MASATHLPGKQSSHNTQQVLTYPAPENHCRALTIRLQAFPNFSLSKLENKVCQLIEFEKRRDHDRSS